MGIIFILSLFLLSLILQGSVLALAGTGGTHPDLLLVLVVAMALLSDSKKGIMFGFIAGILQDVLVASPLGFFTIGKMLAGLLAGFLSQEVYRDFILVPIVVVSLITIVNETVTYLVAAMLFSPEITLLHYLGQFSLPRVVMHLLIMALVYPYLYRVHKRFLFFDKTIEG